jgi:hypothetical protein
MKKDKPRSPRLIIDCKGIDKGDFIIFGYKDFTIEELEVMLENFKTVISEERVRRVPVSIDPNKPQSSSRIYTIQEKIYEKNY